VPFGDVKARLQTFDRVGADDNSELTGLDNKAHIPIVEAKMFRGQRELHAALLPGSPQQAAPNRRPPTGHAKILAASK
jgi:hypothetical protein